MDEALRPSEPGIKKWRKFSIADVIAGSMTERVEIAPYHDGLPRLADADVIR